MKSPHTPPPLSGADDALFDDIERRLQALTTVLLHVPPPVPARCVDEFEDGFLLQAGPPPAVRRRPGARPRG